MILSPEKDLEQVARHANPDEMMAVIAWPNPLKSKKLDIPKKMAEPITRIKERTEDIMLMTILAMILNY